MTAFLLQASPDALIGFLPMLVLFAIFYFVLFLPMQRQKKQQKQMLETLQPGNIVQTTGGIIGTILTVNQDDIVVRVKPDNVKLQIARTAVAGVVAEKQ